MHVSTMVQSWSDRAGGYLEVTIPEGVWVLVLWGRHGHILIHGDDHLLLHH